MPFNIESKYCSPSQAADAISQFEGTFAVIRNPADVYPPYELQPMTPKVAWPVPSLYAIVSDMDGTTTTTEPLCLHSLEYAVRCMLGWPSKEQWPGLSRERDYPHIIGNSTTRHLEYLTEQYGDGMRRAAFEVIFDKSVEWTLTMGDVLRRQEAREASKYLKSREEWSPNDRVRAMIEIYYARYHQILDAISMPEAERFPMQHRLVEEASRASTGICAGMSGEPRRLIAPMPGVALFLATIKGLIDPRDLKKLVPDEAYEQLHRALQRFRAEPLKVALVTSSLLCEAEVVLKEVFSQLIDQITEWPLQYSNTDALLEKMTSPQRYYDAIITASDSCEIRLKPHRDLYNLALHRINVPREKFDSVLGLEDSESGIIAMRTAGIGLAVALPFRDTQGHCLDEATKVIQGGLPTLMYEDGFLLQ